MSALFSQINYNALDYNLEIEKKILSICKPLFQNLGITFFSYSNFLNDGTYLDFSTNIKWQQHYLENFASNAFINKFIHNIFDKNIKYKIWEHDSVILDNNISSNFICDSYNFDIWHGLTIYKKQKTSIEAWHFATKKENYQIVNFYVNNFALLNRFILYFQDKAAELINMNDIDKLIALSDATPLTDLQDISCEDKKTISEDFINQTNIKRYHLKTKQGVVFLSRKETECLLYLTTSKTIKEVANCMSLSPRTVEGYLNNAKRKVGCWTKAQLVDIFLNNSISQVHF